MLPIFIGCLGLSPGALTEDFIKVESDGLLLDKTFNLLVQARRKDPHESLGSKPIFGTLLVSPWGMSLNIT